MLLLLIYLKVQFKNYSKKQETERKENETVKKKRVFLERER